jgi:type II secretory pathway pseudopilin PulG
MTLIELLVVVAIMMLLIITVAPNLATTAEARRGREAARMVSSFISKAQSRAIGRTDWSGFMLAATNTASFAAIDLFLADVPPVYRGDTVPALLTITGSTATTRTASNPTAIAALPTIGGTTDDLIRFDGRGPYYQIDHDPSPGPAITGTSVRFDFRGAMSGADEDAGFQPHNTPWPPSGVPLTFEILRQPGPAGSPLSLGESRAVDLYWSGIGPPMLTVGANAFGAAAYRPFAITASGSFATAGASTAVLFDGTGRLRQAIVRSGATVRRIAITGPLYLLVGRTDRAGQAFDPSPSDDSRGANWQYPDSFWIAIDPATGVVKTAECTPNPSGSTDLERCVSSQAWIRQSLLGDGR